MESEFEVLGSGSGVNAPFPPIQNIRDCCLSDVILPGYLITAVTRKILSHHFFANRRVCCTQDNDLVHSLCVAESSRIPGGYQSHMSF